ncbi:MAG: hypothetical protein EOP56_10365 [Sphingobacteriales bacterium]|nr:MAG: hypothetical protein EOP56_10365 [Sphingobacteriales bacterium]
MKTFFEFQRSMVSEGANEMSEWIKLLLYKENPSVYDVIDFDDDRIYQDSLLFSFFNNDIDRLPLDSILLPYMNIKEKRTFKITTDQLGRFYFNKYGWLKTDQPNRDLEITYADDRISLNDNIEYSFEKPHYVADGIELVRYSLPTMKKFFFDVDGNVVDVEIDNVCNKFSDKLSRAIALIKQCTPEHYSLIRSTVDRFLIFNVDTYLRNSFATLSAQGAAFFNAYQTDYDEVHFIDDIAHQTGHIIFNCISYNKSAFFNIDGETVVQEIGTNDEIHERRTLYIVLHALYTYHCIFTCLSACLDANVFTSKQQHEALGRIKFYLVKFGMDLEVVGKFNDEHKIQNGVFTEIGAYFISEMANSYMVAYNKYNGLVKSLNMDDQPYNFTCSIFRKMNPQYV